MSAVRRAVQSAFLRSAGGCAPPRVFVDGLVRAVLVGAAVLAAGAIAALFVPGLRATAGEVAVEELDSGLAAAARYGAGDACTRKRAGIAPALFRA